MIYSKIQIVMNEYKSNESEEAEKEEKNFCGKLNQALERMRKRENPVFAFMTDIENENMVIMLARLSEDNVERVYGELESIIGVLCNGQVFIKSDKEITVEEFRSGLSTANNNGYVRHYRNITNELKIDFDHNYTFEVSEEIILEERMTKAEALKRANELMGNDEFIKEIERIYCEDNIKEFYCHPVHYHISAGNADAAKALTELLLKALDNNGRLLSRRVSYVHKLKSSCYDEADFDHLICNSQGAAVVLSTNMEKNKNTEMSSDYESVTAYIGELVKLYQKNVLFIFQEIEEKNSFYKMISSEIEENVRMIDMAEGVGNKAQAEAMLKQIIRESKYAKFLELDDQFEMQMESYTLSEIFDYYDKWRGEVIYKKAYKSYGLKEKIVVEELTEEKPAYEELKQLVGLADVKDLVNQIVAMNKIQKTRREKGFSVQQGALHMLFTGNPGSAKTTVARLLTRILFEEGIIKNKKIVECGRGDLVGKYVGWTAKQVRNRFREAKDGVLFIDEAYSLVDDRNGSFGDEAINTIVQEMENHRNDVIVIFAGYPKKMEAFLEKNEGLKSRITFHLDFPNYDIAELNGILEILMQRNGYQCERAVYDKCADIFGKVICDDDFGNGRYVRNLFEHAIMKQSNRLVNEFAGKEIDEKQITYLKAEDFEELESMKKREKVLIGFRCA